MTALIRKMTPAQIITLGFTLLILVGSVLLSLPVSVRDGVELKYIDALYTSTSAVCVTGLIAADAGDTFTPVGQFFLAMLIQFGGLGVTTVGAGVIIAIGRKVNLKGRTLIREALNLVTSGLIFFGGIGFLVICEIRQTRFKWKKFSMHTKVVLSVSVALIAAGTLLLKFTEEISWLGAFFHSVSARTAGFSSYNLGTFSNAGLLVLIVLMFIGASPGSTGKVNISKLPVPECMIGKSVHEVKFRPQFGLNIIIIENNGNLIENIRPDYVSAKGDVLFLCGSREKMYKFTQWTEKQ